MFLSLFIIMTAGVHIFHLKMKCRKLNAPNPFFIKFCHRHRFSDKKTQKIFIDKKHSNTRTTRMQFQHRHTNSLLFRRVKVICLVDNCRQHNYFFACHVHFENLNNINNNNMFHRYNTTFLL